MTAPRAIYLPDQGVVTVEYAVFVEHIPADELPDKIAFYKLLRGRKGGKYADKYQPTIDALEDVLRGMG